MASMSNANHSQAPWPLGVFEPSSYHNRVAFLKGMVRLLQIDGEDPDIKVIRTKRGADTAAPEVPACRQGVH